MKSIVFPAALNAASSLKILKDIRKLSLIYSVGKASE